MKTNVSVTKLSNFDKYVKVQFKTDGFERMILRRLGKLRTKYGIAKQDDIVLIEVEEVVDSYIFNILIYDVSSEEFVSVEYMLIENKRRLLRILRKIKFTSDDYFDYFDRSKVLDLDTFADGLKKRSIVKK